MRIPERYEPVEVPIDDYGASEHTDEEDSDLGTDDDDVASCDSASTDNDYKPGDTDGDDDEDDDDFDSEYDDDDDDEKDNTDDETDDENMSDSGTISNQHTNVRKKQKTNDGNEAASSENDNSLKKKRVKKK